MPSKSPGKKAIFKELRMIFMFVCPSSALKVNFRRGYKLYIPLFPKMEDGCMLARSSLHDLHPWLKSNSGKGMRQSRNQ